MDSELGSETPRSEAAEGDAERPAGHHRWDEALGLATVDPAAHRDPEDEQCEGLDLFCGEDQDGEDTREIGQQSEPQRYEERGGAP